MLKLMLLVRRKAGMSRAEFRDYYESTHAPLAAGVMGRCKRYVRNFVTEEPSGPQDFDVITEFWFDVERRTPKLPSSCPMPPRANCSKPTKRASWTVHRCAWVVDERESALPPR
jgi:uncharacterized protein (TIGR02118 family)